MKKVLNSMKKGAILGVLAYSLCFTISATYVCASEIIKKCTK